MTLITMYVILSCELAIFTSRTSVLASSAAAQQIGCDREKSNLSCAEYSVVNGELLHIIPYDKAKQGKEHVGRVAIGRDQLCYYAM